MSRYVKVENNEESIELVFCSECKYNPSKPRSFYDCDIISHYFWCDIFQEDGGYCPYGKIKEK